MVDGDGGAGLRLMRFREVTWCAQHRQAIIVLEDASGRMLAVAADPDESQRLLRDVSRPRESEHPIYDFLVNALRAVRATPIHVVLAYETGAGLVAAVHFA